MKQGFFTGCGTALVTPFTKTGIDWENLDRLVEDQLALSLIHISAVL